VQCPAYCDRRETARRRKVPSGYVGSDPRIARLRGREPGIVHRRQTQRDRPCRQASPWCCMSTFSDSVRISVHTQPARLPYGDDTHQQIGSPRSPHRCIHHHSSPPDKGRSGAPSACRSTRRLGPWCVGRMPVYRDQRPSRDLLDGKEAGPAALVR